MREPPCQHRSSVSSDIKNDDDDDDVTNLAGTKLAIWDTLHPDVSAASLKGMALISCACFAPNNNFVVVAGSSSGALALWDLREHGKFGGGLCDAAYTSGICSHQSLHCSEVLGICPMSDSMANSRGNASFQFASMDDRGFIAIWLVVESQTGDTASLGHAIAAIAAVNHGTVSQADESLLGVRAGSALRLTCTRSLSIWSSMPLLLAPCGGSYRAQSADRCESTSPDFSVFDETPIGPSISSFVMSPADPNEFLVI